MHGFSYTFALLLQVEDPVVPKKRRLDDVEEYSSSGDDDDEEYFSGDDVTPENVKSLKEKEEEKIRSGGVVFYYNRRRKMYLCPYCKTKDKPKSGFFEHLLTHARDASSSNDESLESRAKHATLLDVLTPKP
jgi:hypothetical protein